MFYFNQYILLYKIAKKKNKEIQMLIKIILNTSKIIIIIIIIIIINKVNENCKLKL